jgi:hypothetical protein
VATNRQETQEPAPRKRRPRAGDMAALKSILWRAILSAEDVLVRAQKPDVVLKAATTIAQASGYYTRLVETSELADRVAALEEALKQHQR